MARLLEDQKLQIVFEKGKYSNHKIDVAGEFLMVEDVSQSEIGWTATIAQNRPVESVNTLCLGCVNLYDGTNCRAGSVCVVSSSGNDDFITVMNPRQQICCLELNQVLDVVFRCALSHQRYTAFPVAGELCTEEIQHFTKPAFSNGKQFVEHMFRFRFNSESVERYSEKPTGRYDGGQILFMSSSGEKHSLKLICSWRGRSSVYKALLLPKIPSSSAAQPLRRSKKQCMRTEIQLRRIPEAPLDDGCNVLMSRHS